MTRLTLILEYKLNVCLVTVSATPPEYLGNLNRRKKTNFITKIYTYPGYDHHCEVCSVLLGSRRLFSSLVNFTTKHSKVQFLLTHFWLISVKIFSIGNPPQLAGTSLALKTIQIVLKYLCKAETENITYAEQSVNLGAGVNIFIVIWLTDWWWWLLCGLCSTGGGGWVTVLDFYLAVLIVRRAGTRYMRTVGARLCWTPPAPDAQECCDSPGMWSLILRPLQVPDIQTQTRFISPYKSSSKLSKLGLPRMAACTSQGQAVAGRFARV